MKAPSSNLRAGLLMVLLAGIFTFGVIRVFSIRFATGEVYPDYSSMKAAPAGAKLLYDSLTRTPGLTLARNYVPLEYCEESDATILLLAVSPTMDGPDMDSIERLAKRGNRVVVALHWNDEKAPESAKGLDKRWGIKLGYDAPQKWLYFSDAGQWHVLDQSGPKISAIDRKFDKGTVVLFAESRDFGNRSVAKLNHLELLSAAIGEKKRVVFDEAHFGMEEAGTVMGLARRFRLTGVAIGLAICAALFIWKNAASFPPPAEAVHSDTLRGRTSMSGLSTLLRRNIKPADLALTCWNEWLVSNGRDVSPDRRVRAEAILRQQGRDPLVAAREIQTVLQGKGPL
jgi:hypothetical protein